jgi:hypothetical protein
MPQDELNVTSWHTLILHCGRRSVANVVQLYLSDIVTGAEGLEGGIEVARK